MCVCVCVEGGANQLAQEHRVLKLASAVKGCRCYQPAQPVMCMRGRWKGRLKNGLGTVTEDECFHWLRGEWKVRWRIEYFIFFLFHVEESVAVCARQCWRSSWGDSVCGSVSNLFWGETRVSARIITIRDSSKGVWAFWSSSLQINMCQYKSIVFTTWNCDHWLFSFFNFLSITFFDELSRFYKTSENIEKCPKLDFRSFVLLKFSLFLFCCLIMQSINQSNSVTANALVNFTF